MQTDVLWRHPQTVVASHTNGGDRDGVIERDDHPHQVQHQNSQGHHVQEWDPAGFLNTSMFSTELLQQQQQQSTNAVSMPVNIMNNSFQNQGLSQSHGAHHQPYSQESFDQPFDVYQSSQGPLPAYDTSRFRQAPSSDLSPPITSQLGLNHEFNIYSQFQPQPSDLHGVHFPHQGQPNQSQRVYEFHNSPPVTPNDGPSHRGSPFTISPASNHSFAAQQDSFSNLIDRRPSTAESVHSFHGEYPDEYSTLSGRAPSGVVPSALHHQYNHRNAHNGPPPAQSFLPHLSQDPQPANVNRSFIPVSKQTHQQPVASFNPQSSYGPPAAAFHSTAGQYIADPNLHNIAPQVLDADSSATAIYTQANAGTTDIVQLVRPVLQQYMETRNRIAFGERTVIVMASKVAQKSYGQERRFLCPPPTAIMIGNSWWTETALGRDDRRPPRVTVSISGESVPPESSVDWTSTSGKPVELGEAPPEPSPFHSGEDLSFGHQQQILQQTYIGRAVGKQLFISDERQKKVEALVKIVAPGPDDEPERVLGTFPSKPIKVISKPSKKRQSAKNMELCINHGSTVSLFHRLRSQTVSTKYLCVSGSGHSFKGSDGAPLPGVDARLRGNTPSFVARTGTWDPFIIYIVDVTKPQNIPEAMPPQPLQPDYPSPPPNAISFMHHGTHIPIYYNQTIVLQCLTSGVVSPVLIIRKVDHDTIVVGGGLQDGAKGVPDHFCAPGEVCGDPVSQLHKVAFEVYDPSKGIPPPTSTGITGAFLSCIGEKVNTYRPSDGRTWNNSPEGVSSRSESPIHGGPPDSPAASSSGSLTDYYANGSPVGSPSSLEGHSAFPSSDGGRVISRRGPKRSNTGGGTAPILKGTSKARRRVNSVGSTGSAGGSVVTSSTRYGLADQAMSSGALWSIDIGESAVWTIVGTEQIRYNFYVPPNLPGTRASGVPLKPVTPFPGIVKYLPPDRAAENPNKHGGITRMLMNNGVGGHHNGMKQGQPPERLITVYGENFNKSEPPLLFFGTEPSPYVDVRCQEVLACLPPNVPGGSGEPEVKLENGGPVPKPMFLVRADGVIYPSSVMFYGK